MVSEIPEVGKRKLISYSEADSFTQCQQKHHYAHVDKLTTASSSVGLSRGTAGHLFFETFFKGLLAGKSEIDAKTAAMNAVMSLPGALDILALCIEWVDKIWPTLGWKIVAVEIEVRLAISETLVYPCKVDLVVEIDGELVLVDHKFLYDFYTQSLIDIFPQMPRYMVNLKANGLDVKYAIYNMIRTRKVNSIDDRYQRLQTRPNKARLSQAINEQIRIMKQIEQGVAIPTHTANKMNCGNCQFHELCAAELRGEDTTLMRKHFFVENTYGYEDT